MKYECHDQKVECTFGFKLRFEQKMYKLLKRYFYIIIMKFNLSNQNSCLGGIVNC